MLCDQGRSFLGQALCVFLLLLLRMQQPMREQKHYLSDQNTHYKGNYGNLLFLWDIIFGTAKITRKYPKEFGVENLSEVSALTQLFWPIFRSPQETKIEEA